MKKRTNESPRRFSFSTSVPPSSYLQGSVLLLILGLELVAEFRWREGRREKGREGRVSENGGCIGLMSFY